jgi:hypothetical protein
VKKTENTQKTKTKTYLLILKAFHTRLVCQPRKHLALTRVAVLCHHYLYTLLQLHLDHPLRDPTAYDATLPATVAVAAAAPAVINETGAAVLPPR